MILVHIFPGWCIKGEAAAICSEIENVAVVDIWDKLRKCERKWYETRKYGGNRLLSSMFEQNCETTSGSGVVFLQRMD